MQQKIPTEVIERAIDNFQAKVAGFVARSLDPNTGRRDLAKKVLAEAFALARAEGVRLDTMKQMLLEEYGKPLPKPDERAGTLVFNLLAWAAMAKISLGRVGRWQAARIFSDVSSVA